MYGKEAVSCESGGGPWSLWSAEGLGMWWSCLASARPRRDFEAENQERNPSMTAAS